MALRSRLQPLTVAGRTTMRYLRQIFAPSGERTSAAIASILATRQRRGPARGNQARTITLPHHNDVKSLRSFLKCLEKTAQHVVAHNGLLSAYF